jgi:predicted small lipoprotein YifL
MRPTSFLAMLFIVTMMATASGCGQKGPLYLPDSEQEQ